MATPTFDVYVRPGLSLSTRAKTSLMHELRELGILCLNPLPDYQIFSTSSNSLDDKIIITAHRQCSSGRPDGPPSSSSTELVGFVSVVILPPIPAVRELVFHSGLAMVKPSIRRSGLIQQPLGCLRSMFLSLIQAKKEYGSPRYRGFRHRSCAWPHGFKTHSLPLGWKGPARLT